MCVCVCVFKSKKRERDRNFVILCKKGKIGSFMYKIDIKRDRKNIRTSVNK